MEVDASMYGNSYWVKNAGQLVRLNPNRVTIATTDAIDPITGNPFGKRLIGYFLQDEKGHIAATFLPDEICHYKPYPDPANEFRGASWLNALLPDVIADLDLTDYKHAFLQNAATPNLAVVFPPEIKREAFDKFRDKMESAHTGPQSGFKTLYLGGGVDVKTVGSNFNDLAMQAVQSAGEVRIAAAAGVPPGLLGLAEALKGSTLNSGNYAATRRRFSDATLRPLWRSACSALSTIVKVPDGSRLWFDDSDVMFLQEDVTDTAAIRGENAKTVLMPPRPWLPLRRRRPAILTAPRIPTTWPSRSTWRPLDRPSHRPQRRRLPTGRGIWPSRAAPKACRISALRT
jgi:phage portal protein BeeE